MSSDSGGAVISNGERVSPEKTMKDSGATPSTAVTKVKAVCFWRARVTISSCRKGSDRYLRSLPVPVSLEVSGVLMDCWGSWFFANFDIYSGLRYNTVGPSTEKIRKRLWNIFSMNRRVVSDLMLARSWNRVGRQVHFGKVVL